MNWIFGTWLIRPSASCRESNPLVRIVMGQLLADTIFYCVCTAAFGTIIIANRCCPGKLLPGFGVDASNWPWGCPRITIDRSMWRRRGESLEEYRARVEAIHHVHQVQPRTVIAMTTEHEGMRLEELGGLTREEVERLPAFLVAGPKEVPPSEGATEDVTVEVRVIPNSTETSVDQVVEAARDSQRIPRSSPDTDTNIESGQGTFTHPLAIPEPMIPQHSSSSSRTPPSRSQSSDNSRSAPTTSTTCALCLCDYETGDRVRELPCEHRFHDICVDPWLMGGRRTCPVCSRVVIVDRGGQEGSISDD